MIQEFRVDKHRLLFDLQPELFMSDRNLLWYAQNWQLPEPEVISVMLRALKPGDCAVDAGANVGFFTVLMSKIVGPEGRVLAIEPDENNLGKLHKNLDVNSCSNVTVFPCALGEVAALVGVHCVSDNGQTSVFGDTEPQAVVGLERLDMLLNQHYRPRFLKMDIEGSEVAALLGCTFDFPYIVSEINEDALKRAGHSAADLFTLLRERGYLRYQLHADGSMPSLIHAVQSVKLTRQNANMLFAPPGIVATRLWPEVEI